MCRQMLQVMLFTYKNISSVAHYFLRTRSPLYFLFNALGNCLRCFQMSDYLLFVCLCSNLQFWAKFYLVLCKCTLSVSEHHQPSTQLWAVEPVQVQEKAKQELQQKSCQLWPPVSIHIPWKENHWRGTSEKWCWLKPFSGEADSKSS